MVSLVVVRVRTERHYTGDEDGGSDFTRKFPRVPSGQRDVLSLPRTGDFVLHSQRYTRQQESRRLSHCYITPRNVHERFSTLLTPVLTIFTDFLSAVVTSEIAQILSLYGGGFLALKW